MKKALQRHLDDLMVLAGCGLILYGTYQVNPLAVWFVGGGMLIAGGIAVGIGEAKQ